MGLGEGAPDSQAPSVTSSTHGALALTRAPHLRLFHAPSQAPGTAPPSAQNWGRSEDPPCRHSGPFWASLAETYPKSPSEGPHSH